MLDMVHNNLSCQSSVSLELDWVIDIEGKVGRNQERTLVAVGGVCLPSVLCECRSSLSMLGVDLVCRRPPPPWWWWWSVAVADEGTGMDGARRSADLPPPSAIRVRRMPS